MEKWIRWEPVAHLAAQYYIDSICEDSKEFKIVLSEFNNKESELQVIFKSSIYFYEKTDDTFILSIINDLYERYGKEFYTEWTFFKVENSCYIQRLLKQSSGIGDSYNLKHFVFIAVDALVHVITDEDPKFVFSHSK